MSTPIFINRFYDVINGSSVLKILGLDSCPVPKESKVMSQQGIVSSVRWDFSIVDLLRYKLFCVD